MKQFEVGRSENSLKSSILEGAEADADIWC